MAHGKRFSNRLSALGLTVAVFFLNAAPAAAQCIMCYASAAGTGSRGIRALQIGILVLLLPTLALGAGILWLAYRRRNSDALESEISGKDSNWNEGLMALGVSPETDGAASRL